MERRTQRQVGPASEPLTAQGLNPLWLGSVGCLAMVGVLGQATAAQALVRVGDRCPAVNQLQASLKGRGYSVGPIDGVFGPQTEAALRQFQQQQRLAADGIAGPQTAKAMGLPPEFSCATAQPVAIARPANPRPKTRVTTGPLSQAIARDEAALLSAGAIAPPASPGIAAGAARPQRFRVATHGSRLNLRQSPGGRILGALDNGATVTVVETRGDWSQLRSGTWVARAWLMPSEAAAIAMTDAPAPEEGPAVSVSTPGSADLQPSPLSPQPWPMEVATAGERLLIRDQPAGRVVGSVAHGVQLQTVAEREGWLELATGGWVLAQWLRPAGMATLPTAQPPSEVAVPRGAAVLIDLQE